MVVGHRPFVKQAKKKAPLSQRSLFERFGLCRLPAPEMWHAKVRRLLEGA